MNILVQIAINHGCRAHDLLNGHVLVKIPDDMGEYKIYQVDSMRELRIILGY